MQNDPTLMGMNDQWLPALGRYIRGGQEPDVVLPVENPSFSDELGPSLYPDVVGTARCLRWMASDLDRPRLGGPLLSVDGSGPVSPSPGDDLLAAFNRCCGDQSRPL